MFSKTRGTFRIFTVCSPNDLSVGLSVQALSFAVKLILYYVR